MKATISELWETGIDILSVNNDEFNSITSITELRNCDNVVIGKTHSIATEILIDDILGSVVFRTVTHPTGHGRIRVCEILIT